MTSAPFARDSVSLRLYPHNELDAIDISSTIVEQAALALRLGFDGVMVSEHHGGFAGYLCNPIQTAGFMLAASDRGWVAPSPVLLPLRPAALVAEEIAWMEARFPGRVGLGLAAGALPLDFDVMDLSLDDAIPRFKRDLPRVVAMLRGEDLGDLRGDKALIRCAEHPIPVLSAAVSPTAARRAARVGAGIILEAMSTVARQRELCDAFDASGGTQPKVLIRRVWLGELPAAAVEAQRKVYESYSSGDAMKHWADDQTVNSNDPSEVADRLVSVLDAVNADALNLRVHLPGIDATSAREQIARLGEEVLPLLRTRLAGRTNPSLANGTGGE
jgi:alkanesulfonate monooxygenase SsuD/methylene tetrahydromethanopterin reductase-like flavin-dependent oxidoreductase (luciferase family)